ncbi:MAG: hypothetical protein U0936_26595 [Planctomycetaceae bacterium]
MSSQFMQSMMDVVPTTTFLFSSWNVSLVSRFSKNRKVGALDIKEILRIGMQIASGLAVAHQQGLVHRISKPSNILLENGVERSK